MNGIQNGSPDGVALVHNSDRRSVPQLRRFVCRRAAVRRTGMISTDIGSERDTAALRSANRCASPVTGTRLFRLRLGGISRPATPGCVNQGQTFTGVVDRTTAPSVDHHDAGRRRDRTFRSNREHRRSTSAKASPRRRARSRSRAVLPQAFSQSASPATSFTLTPILGSAVQHELHRDRRRPLRSPMPTPTIRRIRWPRTSRSRSTRGPPDPPPPARPT